MNPETRAKLVKDALLKAGVTSCTAEGYEDGMWTVRVETDGDDFDLTFRADGSVEGDVL